MKKESLICSTFFSEDILIDISRIFPMLVLGTMSSGKSTLINAMLGQDILPSKNKACTAKVFSILDIDTMEKPKLYITSNDGYVSIIENNLEKALEDVNNIDTVRDVLILGEIQGVFNTEKALLIVDTPGPNNSQDLSHEAITNEILGKINGGLVLYVINATQMGVNDDARLLKILKAHLDRNKEVKVLFVINKMDEVDYEKESIFELIIETKKYIENQGIKNPNIIPVSALAASLFKKVLAGEKLTRNQCNDFLYCYDLFKTSDVRMASYAIMGNVSDGIEKVVTMRGQKYRVAELTAAIENTGMLYLEKYIQGEQISSSEKSILDIDVKNR